MTILAYSPTSTENIPFTDARPVSKSLLFTVYNKFRSFARKNPHLLDEKRVNKALGIMQSKAYYAGDRSAYLPSTESCGCKDWEFRFAHRRKYTGPCKHMIAEMMLAEIMAMCQEYDISQWLDTRQEQYTLENAYRV